uniref:Cuticle protein n=1 Tax=Rhodnius prolixus TaxID=13249 RepID=T1HPN5_RHOPR
MVFKRVKLQVHYSYAYAIDDKASGVVSDRWEERRGEYVKGAYSLLEPGGKVRTVDYQVDGDGGFQAIVKTVVPDIGLDIVWNSKH